MKARREYRNRDNVEVDVLDALVDRQEIGMTVFELRSRVDVDIETLEDALCKLRDDHLISLETVDSRSVIRPDERVIPTTDDAAPSESVLGRSIGRVVGFIRTRFRR